MRRRRQRDDEPRYGGTEGRPAKEPRYGGTEPSPTQRYGGIESSKFPDAEEPKPGPEGQGEGMGCLLMFGLTIAALTLVTVLVRYL